jgi:sulfate transport system permease protein
MLTNSRSSRPPLIAALRQRLANLNLSVQPFLLGLTLMYLGLVLLLPLLLLLYETLHLGLPPLITALSTPEFRSALQLTLVLTAIAVPLNTLFGLCAAWVLARHHFPGRTLILSLIDLPFAVSPVVAGLMIVLLYGRTGWFGEELAAIGFKVVFALPGMAIATLFITLPFVVREVIPVLEEMGSEQEDAARTLGASDWQIFWRITLPHIRWGLLYGVLLTNARAMGEFGAVAVVSGSILGRTQTLPIFVEQAYKNYQTQASFGAAAILALLGLLTLVLKEVVEKQGDIRSRSV